MTTRRDLLRATAVLPALGALPVLGASASKLLCEPLAGHFTHESVRLWIQADDSVKATIIYKPVNATSEAVQFTTTIQLDASRANSATVEIAKLKANTRYRYTVTLGAGRTGETHHFRTAPAPTAPPADFRVYMGSCAYTEAMSPSGNPYGDEFQIFDTIAGRIHADSLPHFMLWLGDNLYFRPKGKFLSEADFSSVARMEARYRNVRAMDMFQKLFAATHHYAIWDDHDYGPNDSFKSFEFKADALRLFRQYWPNPEMGSKALPGTWTSFKHQDAEFFFLDDRYYRDDEKAAPSSSKAMFGPQQIAWLQKSLANSKATFKLVCNGSQLLSEDENGHHSGWHNYQAERDPFLAWLAKEKITGLVFLSGDRHNTQVFRLKQEGAPAVYEYSCSPFTSRLSKLSKKDRANPRFVEGLGVEQRNFGTLEFAGAGDKRKIVAACFDANGKQFWQRTLASAKTDANGEPI
ncbi:MAG: alkaline phosphatase D family protein [Betaproteobacteria bacterium]